MNKAQIEVANYKEVKQISNQSLLAVVAIAEVIFVIVGYLLF
jgi:hypothetical protein